MYVLTISPIETGILFLLFLCWGSFLNVLGFRLIQHESLFGRSRCPSCSQVLAWYDLIPVISWIILQGRCRSCHEKISVLYPFIELLTALVGIMLIQYINPYYWLGYFLFFSALIVTIRTDFESMLISRYMTWAMIPIANLLSIFQGLPIPLTTSILGAFFGYAILWCTSKAFKSIRKIEGLGQGDVDLLAMIGAFAGVLGAWIALLIGSLLGTAMALRLIHKERKRDIYVPFGPWLAAGAIIYVFTQHFWTRLIIGTCT